MILFFLEPVSKLEAVNTTPGLTVSCFWRHGELGEMANTHTHTRYVKGYGL